MRPSERDGFVIYKSHFPVLKTLSREMLGDFLYAVYEYQTDGIIPPPTSPIYFPFMYAKIQFDADDAKYESVVERNKVNGKNGGRPKKEPEKPTGFNDNPKNPVDPKKPDKEEDRDKGEDRDRDKDKEEEKNKKNAKKGEGDFEEIEAEEVFSETEPIQPLKNTPPKVAPKGSPINVFPADFPHGSNFRQAWGAWVQHRKEIRAKLTASTIEKQLELLSGFTEAQAIEIINNSIQNGWRGVFPEKLKTNGKSNQTHSGQQQPLDGADLSRKAIEYANQMRAQMRESA